jgi:hypothetical protein
MNVAEANIDSPRWLSTRFFSPSAVSVVAEQDARAFQGNQLTIKLSTLVLTRQKD